MRVKLTNKGTEQFYGRAAVGVAARAAGIIALDAPFADFSNIQAFTENTQESIQLGYEGRMIIHPSQIEIANKLYAPSDADVEHARKVVAAFEEGLTRGLAAVALDGKMVDTPVYLSAQGVLSRHNEITEKA
jgi:citrate lyase subunit beta/citryl-CoA lyase